MKRTLSSLALLVCGVLAGCVLVEDALQTARYSPYLRS